MTVARDIGAIAIGASAGGVDAVRTVLRGLPADLAAPVLVVIHLRPDRRSLLAEVLGAACACPVVETEDKRPLVPGVVHVAPPDYHLLVENPGQLALSRDEPVLFSRPAIDVLFESASDVFGPALVAILLTGASRDGARGLAAVRAAGGVAIVQDPLTAHAPEMPRAGIEVVVPDVIGDPPAIAAWLRDHAPRSLHQEFA